MLHPRHRYLTPFPLAANLLETKKRPGYLTYTKNFEQSTEQVAPPADDESTPENISEDSDYHPPVDEESTPELLSESSDI